MTNDPIHIGLCSFLFFKRELGKKHCSIAFILTALFLIGCTQVRISPEELSPPPDFPIRSLILVFEEENSFSPVAAGAVTVRVSEPNTLVSPAHVLTDAQGGVSVSYKPVALYEEAALKAGDLVVDYKATLYITLEKGGKIWEWELDDWLTYAYYFDPLYQGLNRTAEQGPDYINLIVTDKY